MEIRPGCAGKYKLRDEAHLAPLEIQPTHWVNATGEGRVMRLKGYGNAIHPVLASEFVGAVMEIMEAKLERILPAQRTRSNLG